MCADNAVANTEAQARAFACGLRGEEWIEDALGFADAGAVVDERDFDGIGCLTRANPNFAVIAGFLDGVVRVIENIQENLLQLLRVAHRELNVFVEFFGDLDAVAGKIVAAQADRLAEDGVHRHGLPLRWPLARKT